MTACTHNRWVYPEPYEDDWGEMVYPESYPESTTEDVGVGAFRCTQCGLIEYYTGLWKAYHEDGAPCSGSDGVPRIGPRSKS